MRSKNILIIGLGNIGKRYLQGLEGSKFKLNLHLLEKRKQTILKLKKDLRNNSFKKRVIIYSRPTQVQKKNYFLAIVATTADSRVKITKLIMNKFKIKYWLVEKPLGQSLEDIRFFENFNFKNNSWINIPRKSFKYYKFIKKILKNKKIKKIEAVGNNWGVCCNGIHFINLFSWLLNTKLKAVNCSNLRKWKKTKKRKFWEAEGKILLKFKNNCNGLLSSTLINKKKKSCKLLITTNNKKIIYDETKGKIFLNGKLKFQNKKLPFLSSYISLFIKNIIKNKQAELPLIRTTIDDHNLFIKSLLESWKMFKKSKTKSVPIT